MNVGTPDRDKTSQRRPRERPYKLFDERGLFVLVAPAGGRLWRFRYKLGAIEKLISLGAHIRQCRDRGHVNQHGGDLGFAETPRKGVLIKHGG
jgi:hypothetical protein